MDSENTITEVTRRAIIDYLTVGRNWSGALQEDEFLGRIYDLNRMRSTDRRREFNTAAKDIWKHRVMNSDWSDDWVFTDSRFDLLHGPDEPFLKFLAETVHPVVRPDTDEATHMVFEYNEALQIDGWEIYRVRLISDKPVFGFRHLVDANLTPHHIEDATRVAERLTGTHIARQVGRLREAAAADPDLAIGTAKEFLESVCKSILTERGIALSSNEDLPDLVRTTIKAVSITPADLANDAHLQKTIAVLLNNLGSVGRSLAELRNQFGTGHGRSAGHVSLSARHAKLAIGAASTLAGFLYECHEAEPHK